MQLQETLGAMGYGVGTRSVGMVALCSIELNGRVRTFVSNREKNALHAAVTHVELLEQWSAEQQRRLQCEGGAIRPRAIGQAGRRASGSDLFDRIEVGSGEVYRQGIALFARLC